MNQVKEFSEMSSKSNRSSKNLSPNEFCRRNKILREFGDINGKKAPLIVSQASNKKILGDRNCNNTQLSNLSKTFLKATSNNGKLSATSHEKDQSFEKIHPLSDAFPSVEYDPVTNYTLPRPTFLRYNPNRRKEILARMKDCEEESLSDENLFSSSSVSSKSKDKVKQFEDEVEKEEEVYGGDYEEFEVDDERFWCSKNVCKWFFPFVILLLLNYYLFSISKPLHEKNSSIQNFHCRGSTYILKTLMGLGDICLYNGNEMCDLVISDAVNDSDTWIIDQNNKELSSAEGDVSNEDPSPFQKMCDSVISDIVNDSDTWMIDENNKELSSAEGDVSNEDPSPFQKMCDSVISDVVNDSDTWMIDENNKELSSAEGDVSNEDPSPFQKMCDSVISDVVNDSDTWMIDENNKELSSAEGDVSNEDPSPFQKMCDSVISDVVNDSDTWMIDENNKELSSAEGESNEELSPCEENTVSSSSFNSGRYKIGIHMGVIHKCFNVGEEMCDLPASGVLTLDGHGPRVKKSVESMHENTDIDQKLLSDDQNEVLTNTDLIPLDCHEPSVKKSVVSMHESTDIDQKLVSDDQNEVAMSTDEFLMHGFSNESEEIGKEVNMVYESDKDESFESNSYEVSNKFGLLAIQDAVNMKLILFSGCTLSVMLALWIALSMCFSKSGNILKDSNVTQLSSDHPKDEQKESFSLPCSESVEENESKDSNLFNKSFSVSPKDKNVQYYASRPPAVELLCEFSILDDLKSSNKTEKTKVSENSTLSKSQDKENSQVSRPRKTVKTAMNSLSSNNGKANENQLKKEMMTLATPTPLRRSSRLQNRVTPPYLQNRVTPPNL